ncbi:MULTISPECIES: tyrosinase family protein [Paraburkholderia]|uniref:tyrosinase family protein n=1 Tax=Paraburkholderia TaxID=1822464 RepID=UPI00225C30DB|nr:MULTISPECIES: tyrosinase family protein [Paraburkholderia]MCX4177751.1 tyrosinase family protein [Paraburkholderia madseniana]MDQ6465738.1 tyrosinase family protein [Paraburkholderia madseniana]
MSEFLPTSRSRRELLKAMAVAVGASILPLGKAKSASLARYRRVNVSNPQLSSRILASYKKAIRAMLALPADDPRNWYRHALIHTMDCPHGNWWFLPWHRAYLGWFEQICRELSADPDFTLPYWDWTADPRIPDAMFDDVLDPNNPAFIATRSGFENKIRVAISNAGYWSEANGTFNPRSQYGQLLSRMIRFPDDLWFDVVQNPMGSFFYEQPNTRGLTRQAPELNANTKYAVSFKTLYPALAAKDFTTFGSLKSASHSGPTGSGILENQPHNLIHNCIGTRTCNLVDSDGFMVDLMSPTDPIFFLHHANIDRLWDVWTRKQAIRGLPTLPDGISLKTTLPDNEKTVAERNTDYYRWAREPFLFFVDAKGKTVTKTRTGDYETIGDFDYDYQPGAGEDVVAIPAAAKIAPLPPRVFAAIVENRAISAGSPGSASVRLPANILVRTDVRRDEALVAKITMSLPPWTHEVYVVVLNGAPNTAAVQPDSPHYAGILSMFGHHVMPGPYTFSIPISDPISRLRTMNLLNADGMVSFRIVPFAAARGVANVHEHNEQFGAVLTSVVIESY